MLKVGFIIFQVNVFFLTGSLSQNIQPDTISISPFTDSVAFIERNAEFIVTCTSKQFNVTWEIPILNFAELHDQEKFNETALIDGPVLNNLPSRANITNKYQDELFTSELTVQGALEWDEGYYTCRSITEHDPPISKSVFIFIGYSENTFDVQTYLNPLKSLYIVKPNHEIVIPCYLTHKVGLSWSGNVELQKKINNGSSTWKTIEEDGKVLQQWNFENHRGIIFNVSDVLEPGRYSEYRCKAYSDPSEPMKHEDWGSSFFITVEETAMNEGDAQPLIQPRVKFLIFQTRSTFSLACEVGANYWNVSWQLPHHDMTNSERVVINVVTNSFKTLSVLTVNNSSYLDTGYYKCHRDDDASYFSEQFVFVQDWSNLLLPAFHRSNKPGVSFGSTSVVVGCAPTHPSVEVKLYRTGKGRVLVYPSKLKEGKWSLDPFKGFIISKTTWDLENEYECAGIYSISPSVMAFSLNNQRITTNNKFEINVSGIELLPPSNPDQVVQGDRVNLTCRWKIDEESSDHLKWIFTSSNSNNTIELKQLDDENVKGMEFKSFEKEGFSANQIVWKNIPLEAAGTYQCQFNSYKSANYNLEIKSGGATVPLVRPEIVNSSNDVISVKNGDLVILFCHLNDAHLPPAEINEWMTGEGDRIEWNGDIANQSTNGNRTSLIIRAAINGTKYKCSFSNQAGRIEKDFVIVVEPSYFDHRLYGAILILTIIFLSLFARFIWAVYTKQRFCE